MTHEALDRAVSEAGSQIKLCRYIGKSQSSVWTWFNTNGKGASADAVPDLVALTKGECTAPDFRPDIYDWLRPLESYIQEDMPKDAAMAGIDLLWHQVPEREAINYLIESRAWKRDRARAAVDFLLDNGMSWQPTGDDAA